MREDTERRNYFQITGRPNKGIKNAAQYGLTQEEVIELIDNGEWNNFRNWFNKKKDVIQQIIKQRYICPICAQKKVNLNLWLKSRAVCKECDNRVKKYSLDIPGHGICNNCHGYHKIQFKVADLELCGKCTRLFGKLLENESKS